MQHILVALLLLVGGCNSGVGAGSQGTTGRASTGLKAGLYTGTITCQRSASDTCGDRSFRDWIEDVTKTITIGESGLPLSPEGGEVSVGATASVDIGGLTLSGSTTSVTVSENGVVVQGNVEFTGGGLVESLCTQSLGGLDSRTYKSDGQGRIEYTSILFLGDELGPVMSNECSGILTP